MNHLLSMAAKMPDALSSINDEFNLPQIPDEELERLTLEEDLSECQRIKILLTKKDQPAQQQYVFSNAVNIFKNNPQGIQEQIIPLLIKGISTYGETIQIEAGKSFIVLIEQDILLPLFYKELKTLCLVMLKQWSKAILREWIKVYVCVTLKLIEPSNELKLKTECLDNALKLLESQQPVSVKQSGVNFIGVLASKNFINSTESTFIDKFYPKLTDLTTHGNWEIKISVCRELLSISKYLGKVKSIELIYPLIKILINDLEADVQRKAIKQMFKHVVQEAFPNDFKASSDFKRMLTHILGIANSQTCALSTRNSVLKMIGSLIQCLDSLLFQNDKDFEGQMIFLLKNARKSEFGRHLLPSILQTLTHLYAQNNRFSELFYPEIAKDYIQSELTSQGLTKDIKKAISGCLPHLLLASFKSQEDLVSQDIMSKCQLVLKNTNRDIFNEFVVNVYPVFDFIHSIKEQINDRLLDMFDHLIKKPLLETLEPVIIQNWRHHLNFFEKFLSKYLLIAEKDEATLIVFPLFLHGLKSPKTSKPVKKYISDFLADLIHTQANVYLRLSIQEAMLKDFAASDSHQLRQVFVYFLEAVLPHISKSYFKSVFFDAYVSLSVDHVYEIQLHFVILAPQVRQKLDDLKSIERLLASVESLKTDKGGSDIQEAIERVLKQLKDAKFLQQVQSYQVTTERELSEKEQHIREIERTQHRDDATVKKKKEMEQFIQMMRGGSDSHYVVFKSPRSAGNKTEMQHQQPRGRNFLIGSTTKEEVKHSEEVKQNPFKARRGSNSGLKIMPVRLAAQSDKMAAKTPSVIPPHKR